MRATKAPIKLPQWVMRNIGVRNAHEYRALKRRQVRAAERAIHELLMGSCYAPVYGIVDILGKLQEYKKAMRVSEWGR